MGRRMGDNSAEVVPAFRPCWEGGSSAHLDHRSDLADRDGASAASGDDNGVVVEDHGNDLAGLLRSNAVVEAETVQTMAEAPLAQVHLVLGLVHHACRVVHRMDLSLAEPGGTMGTPQA